MKILLLGDIHSQWDKLDMVLTEELPFDLFICTGDVYTTHIDQPIIDKWSHKGLTVFGNHDTEIQTFERIPLYLEKNELKIAGLNGVYRSNQLTKANAKYWTVGELMFLSHLKDVDIFVSHEPFYQMGIKDEYKQDLGNKLLTDVVTYMQPKLFICGHTHKYRFQFFGGTVAISLPLIHKGYAVAYIDNNKLTNIEVILRDKRRVIRI